MYCASVSFFLQAGKLERAMRCSTERKRKSNNSNMTEVYKRVLSRLMLLYGGNYLLEHWMYLLRWFVILFAFSNALRCFSLLFFFFSLHNSYTFAAFVEKLRTECISPKKNLLFSRLSSSSMTENEYPWSLIFNSLRLLSSHVSSTWWFEE